QQAAAALRFGEPRPRSVRGARRVPPRPRAERAAPPRRLRLGHPLLHRRAAGPPGDADHLRTAAGPPGRHRADRDGPAQRLLRAPRPDGAAPPLDGSGLKRPPGGRHTEPTVTVPFVPSTVMSAPSGMRLVASGTETTQGIPSSRLMIMAWL